MRLQQRMSPHQSLIRSCRALLQNIKSAVAEVDRPHRDMQGLFLAAVSQAFEKACEAMSQEHSTLLATEQDNARVLNHR